MLVDLERLVEADRRGDPESLLRWTSKSVRHLAGGLRELGHQVALHDGREAAARAGVQPAGERQDAGGPRSTPTATRSSGTSTRSRSGRSSGREPVICVDTKKKELVGDFKNAGREWRPKGEPELVRVHDFKDKQLGKAIPYGVYDIAADQGWVNVGIDHDTAQFAVNSIRGWWEHLGQPRYPNATTLQITADCGGSNGNRTRLWKVELQNARRRDRARDPVCHFPPGTSKWNKIEHRLFCFITMNWRGKPLVSLETIINLIGATTTRTGLEVYARLDDRRLPRQDQGHRRRAGRRQPPPRSVPPGVELHHQTANVNYEQALSTSTSMRCASASCCATPTSRSSATSGDSTAKRACISSTTRSSTRSPKARSSCSWGQVQTRRSAATSGINIYDYIRHK